MEYEYKELTGKCKTCLFKCNRVEDINFSGVEKCEYYTAEQITIEQISINQMGEELKKK